MWSSGYKEGAECGAMDTKREQSVDGAVDTKSSLALALSRVSSPVFILCTAVTRMIKVLDCGVSHELQWKLARETPLFQY